MKSGTALTSKAGRRLVPEHLNMKLVKSLFLVRETFDELHQPPPAPQLTVAKRMGSPLTI